ncbi:hypothetical protein EJ05DRAFT_504190 [Pseudovirgaria hyperparasitica]|uniref:Uncharacterized protein n=1 Tax=Pseudovirgaria hyperparasitica TaxID=470096 RepID=A0A6A6VWA9_9PEZI|nr:uncharacterized protein EJ05DRAFT_504190 [Pseudovirgaria hyperparasitica]KAF2754076.1 hypothetical protein EJ05DRAFT_504190 [Pseudovirgaria hyperparasitica]
MSRFWPYSFAPRAQPLTQPSHAQVNAYSEYTNRHVRQHTQAPSSPPDLTNSIKSFRTAMLDRAARHLGCQMFSLIRATLHGANTPIGTPDLYTHLGTSIGNPSILINSVSRRYVLPFVEPHWYTTTSLFAFGGVLPHPATPSNNGKMDSHGATELYIKLASQQLSDHHTATDVQKFGVPLPILPADFLALIRVHAVFVAGSPFGASFAERWVVWDGPGCLQNHQHIMARPLLLAKVNVTPRPLGQVYDVVAGLCMGGNRASWGKPPGSTTEHGVWALWCRRAERYGLPFQWRYFLIVSGPGAVAVSWDSIEALLRALVFLNRPELLREEIYALPAEIREECEIVE